MHESIKPTRLLQNCSPRWHKEASTKLIKMLKDDGLLLACLVEFLYTGGDSSVAPRISFGISRPVIRDIWTWKSLLAAVAAHDICPRSKRSVDVDQQNHGSSDSARDFGPLYGGTPTAIAQMSITLNSLPDYHECYECFGKYEPLCEWARVETPNDRSD